MPPDGGDTASSSHPAGSGKKESNALVGTLELPPMESGMPTAGVQEEESHEGARVPDMLQISQPPPYQASRSPTQVSRLLILPAPFKTSKQCIFRYFTSTHSCYIDFFFFVGELGQLCLNPPLACSRELMLMHPFILFLFPSVD